MPDPKPLSRAALQRAIVDRIVADLSPAMRAALLWLPADGTRRVRKTGRGALYSVRGRRIAANCEGILVFCGPSDQPARKGSVWPPNEWWLTDLGKLVRERVAAKASDG